MPSKSTLHAVRMRGGATACPLLNMVGVVTLGMVAVGCISQSIRHNARLSRCVQIRSTQIGPCTFDHGQHIDAGIRASLYHEELKRATDAFVLLNGFTKCNILLLFAWLCTKSN